MVVVLRMWWFSTGRGEGSLGLLEGALQAIRTGDLPAQIEFVFSNREQGEEAGSDRYLEFVREAGIPLVTCSSRRFRLERGVSVSERREEFDEEVIRRLDGFSPDVCVLAGYMLILSGRLCSRYPAVNLHPALPDGPTGTWREVIWELIERGARETGATVHVATEDVDRGPPVAYVRFPIRGGQYDRAWSGVEGRPVSELRSRLGEELALFRLIREEGKRWERPLVLETLKVLASGELLVTGEGVFDRTGRPAEPRLLNAEVQRSF